MNGPRFAKRGAMKNVGLGDILAALESALPCIRSGQCTSAVECFRAVQDLLASRSLDPLDRMILRKSLTRVRYVLETANADTPDVAGALRALEVRICA